MELNKKMATMMTDEQLLQVKTYCEGMLGTFKGTKYSDVDDQKLFKLWQDSEDRLDILQAEHEAACEHGHNELMHEAWWDEVTTNTTIKHELHYRECKEGLKMVCDVMKWREENRLFGM